MKIGGDVGCCISMNGQEALFLGYGTYVGDEVPPDLGGQSLTSILAARGQRNPKILLESGDVVWGCECWWGPKAVIEEQLKGRTITTVSIADFRTQIGCSGEVKEPKGNGFWGSTPTTKKDFWS